jgi:hypothetical protein
MDRRMPAVAFISLLIGLSAGCAEGQKPSPLKRVPPSASQSQAAEKPKVEKPKSADGPVVPPEKPNQEPKSKK